MSRVESIAAYGAALLAIAVWTNPTIGAAELGAAEPGLRTVKLGCRQAELLCEVADSDATRARGLMHRRELPRGRGMLFVFPSPRPLSFWMKNTLIPLSIAYLDPKGVIRELHDLTPHREEPVASLHSNLQYAIEVPKGWWREIGARVGDRVEGLSALSPPAR